MFVDLPSVRLHYKLEGSGDPLLLLHGNSENHKIFDPLTEKLRDYFTVHAIDSRNHGQSGIADSISYDNMAEDIYQFIKILNLGEVYIAGFSDGAITSLILAMNHPEVLKKMILMGPNTEPEDLTPEAVALINELITDHESPLFKMIFTEPHLDMSEIAKITVPSLLIFGENDLFKQEMVTRLAKTLPKSTLNVLNGHDHLSYVVGNDLLFPDIVNFFDKKIKS
jgi:pimeloyl-ACP methyl ester carboxylesterase